jgi:uncharacterized membrane protein YfcA
VSGVDALLLGLGVFAGASTQRVTGLGFALVSSPLLVLVAGPFQGVLLSNLLALLGSVVVLALTWRQIALRRVLLLAAPALALVPVGAWVARRLPAPVLLVTIGALVVVALVAVLASERARVFRGTGGALAAGGLSGFMNVTAGVGGPAVVLYAASTNWEQRAFVASLQPYLLVLNLASIVAKGGLPRLPATELLASFAALALGIAAGQLLAGRISAAHARRAVEALALAGGVAAVVKGVMVW